MVSTAFTPRKLISAQRALPDMPDELTPDQITTIRQAFDRPLNRHQRAGRSLQYDPSQLDRNAKLGCVDYVYWLAHVLDLAHQ
jgi:hypothetical protein